jgi:hypothetical protein
MAITPISNILNNKKNLIMGYDRYQVEEGVRTLQRAKEIEGDPAFLRAIQLEADRQIGALNSIAKKGGSRADHHREEGGL